MSSGRRRTERDSHSMLPVFHAKFVAVPLCSLQLPNYDSRVEEGNGASRRLFIVHPCASGYNERFVCAVPLLADILIIVAFRPSQEPVLEPDSSLLLPEVPTSSRLASSEHPRHFLLFDRHLRDAVHRPYRECSCRYAHSSRNQQNLAVEMSCPHRD